MNSIKILLIEDNPGDVELTRMALNEARIKNQLEVVNNGEEALDYLFKRKNYIDASTPDIILLDLNLPKVDGREVLRVCKAETQLMSIPIIILSSSEAAVDIAESYELHANCFVSKPVQLDGFLKVIQSIEHFWIDIVRLPKQDK